MTEDNDKKTEYMHLAIKYAKKGFEKGEVPVGAVIVSNGKVVSYGFNLRTKKQMATAHAEVIAINKACKKFKSWRLPSCELYVTLEPCPMCMGACLNSRIEKIYFGAYEQKGITYTKELSSQNILNHTIEVEGGVCEEECSALLKKFFSSVRKQSKKMKE